MGPDDSNNDTLCKKRKCLFEKEGKAPKLKTDASVKRSKITTITTCSLLEKYDAAAVQGAEKLSLKEAKLLVDVLEGKKEETFLKNTGCLKEFRKMLLQIIISDNFTAEAVTPGIIAHLGANTDYLFDQVENDETFILLALTTGINCDFFSSDQEVEVATGGGASDDSEEALLTDFWKIKSRWAILDNIENALHNQSAGTDAFIYRLINRTAHSMKRSFFDRMLNDVSRYFESLKAAGRDMVEPLDASFSVSMIDRINFEKVTNLVERNLITFFCSVANFPQNQYDFNLTKESSRPGVFFLKHKRRLAALRNYTLKNIIIKTSEILAQSKNVVEDDVVTDFDEMGQIFDGLVYRLDLSQSFSVIKCWEVPLPVLLRVFNDILTETKKRGILVSLDNFERYRNSFFRPRWCDKRFGWLVEKIIEERGLVSISENGMDYVIDIMLKLNCSASFCAIFEKYKDTLSVKRIKDMAHFIVTKAKSCSSTLEILLNNFPWLLNTWFDYEGNTLLCLCVRFGYKYLNNLLALDMVKKHINVESMDGRNPLFMAADYPNRDYEFHRLWRIGGADLTHVNRHHESVFHRLAASNNSTCLRQLKNHSLFVMEETKSILELRRKGDAATALMVALARENVDVASILMNLGALATTKFGRSKTLRTAEALFLKKKQLSVALLDEEGIEPMSNIIIESFKEKALFEEECFVPMTGIENNGKVDNNEHSYEDGEVAQCLGIMVSQKEKGYFSRIRKEKHRNKILDNNNPSSLSLDDSTWSIFSGNRKCPNFERVKLLLNGGKKKEPRKSIEVSAQKFQNEKCEDFEHQSSSSSSSSSKLRKDDITVCSHSFHGICWKDLCDSNIKCPTCRKSTTSLYFMDSSFSPEPNTNIPNPPPTNVRQFRRKQETMKSDDDEKYPNIVRYEFLIDGKWVDESTQSNK